MHIGDKFFSLNSFSIGYSVKLGNEVKAILEMLKKGTNNGEQ